MAKVSIIVPVYNVEEYLEKCLDSLVNQTLKDVEIIVVNDGSPDNSQKIIDKFAKKYPKSIKSYIKKNGGLSDARNFGIKKAKGEFLAFVDSDDYVKADMFEKMYNKALETKADIVVCDTINVYDSGHAEIRKSNLHYSNEDDKNYIISPPMACTRIYKKHIFEENSFKKGILYEDLHFTPSLILKNKVAFVEEGLYYYLQRSGSIMNQTTFNIKFLDIFKVLEHNKEVLEKKYAEEVEYLYITHLLRSAALRFLNYDNSKPYLEMINETMKSQFPNWEKNKYFQKSSLKLRLICHLVYFKKYKMLKIIKKVTNN